MPSIVDVAIIGAGPAGLAAAEVLAGKGLAVRLLDEGPRAGGQLLRRPTAGPVRTGPLIIDGLRRRGFRLLACLAAKGITIDQGAQVLGIFPDNRLLVHTVDGRVVEMAARRILCATGARERFIPFPGWTLPGVIATGAAQILLKTSGMLPAEAILVGGTGPLPLLLAGQLAAHGGRVKAVLDPSGWEAKYQVLRMLPRHADKLAAAAWLMASLARYRVPMHANRWIVGATGRDRVQAVTVARADRHGSILPDASERYSTDCLAVGFGFVPNIELLLHAGCEAVHLTDRGGWVIRTDERLETSVANVFAAGEVTGIAGGAKSLIEGRLGGLSILDSLNKAGRATAVAAERRRLLRRRHHELVWGAVVNRISRVPARWVSAIPDDTLICRCEDVRMGDLRQRMSEGFDSYVALKKATRCGMGNCQGRICGSIIDDILEVQVGAERSHGNRLSTRSPVKPVSLGALAAMERLP
jgi:D-hydroxyproline dehydrogenase subunit alpha